MATMDTPRLAQSAQRQRRRDRRNKEGESTVEIGRPAARIGSSGAPVSSSVPSQHVRAIFRARADLEQTETAVFWPR
jgi:hypothetical protein